MRRATRAVMALTVAVSACAHQAPAPQQRAPLELAAQRYAAAAAALDVARGHPRATTESGAWQQTRMNDWTSGFFPGTLWYLYEYTRNPQLRVQAERWTLPLSGITNGSYSHDLGFQFNSSFVNALRITGDERFRAPALNAARLLAARFNPRVGAIKSWDWMPPERPYPVIADNMMNLELLFWGARQPGGDARWKDIAVRHAFTTLKHHLREDGGSYHVVVFDPADGRVLERITHQGYADSSTWARGHAWLLYGFTMAFRETGEPQFLAAARRVAEYFSAHLPEDHVPCWDFQAPGCPATAKRDASAAAIAASGLLELSTYGDNGYRAAADRILATLQRDYIAPRNAASILAHAVGNMPEGTEVDVGLSYGDYYFVEALLRRRALAASSATSVLPARTPRVFTARGELLRASKERLRADDQGLRPVLDRLIQHADSALRAGPFTVTAKQRMPPSGDKRDYMSTGPYWWPDSTKPNGLPYIRRDGQVNQELRRDSDVLRWYALVDAVEKLAYAYYFTDDAKYADRAALLLRTWFIDPATRMNPHLRYGQAIPGVVEGRGIGIIDTRDLGRLTDAVSLISTAPAWTATDQTALRAWLASYLDWLATSDHGRDEADEANNHGTWYDVQVVALSLFLDDTARARTVAENARTARIASQIDSAGRQPLELARTRSLHYSVENLEAMTRLAEMARHVGVDLWHWRAPNGAGIRKAIDFVAPYADAAIRWPGQQITRESDDLFLPLLLRAHAAYGDARYRDLLTKLPAGTATHRVHLLYPAPLQLDDLSRYKAKSDSVRAVDRAALAAEASSAGVAGLTPAPTGPGFFVNDSMTPAWFAQPEAGELAKVLVSFQAPNGGWSKRIAFARPRLRGEGYTSEGNRIWLSTLDNGATTEQLRFLAARLAQVADTAQRGSYRRGLDYLLVSQHPTGCWPQIYPLAGGYHDALTFNDDATISALEVLRAAARDTTNVPTAVRTQIDAALERGVQCIVLTQVVVNDTRTVWGAQHDPRTLAPVKARAYEHASLSGRESAAILNFLMTLDAPSAEVVRAVYAGTEWFRKNAIYGYTYEPRQELVQKPGAAALWARFYEIGTNRPIFSDRDGIVRYNLNEVGEERRRGYLWYTDEPATTLRRFERWQKKHPLSE